MIGTWRPMRVEDIPAVTEIADIVHGEYTEPATVYAERQSLYPDGCQTFILDGRIAGFLISHPWHRGAVPKIGAMLCALPIEADIYYLHDIALLNAARGSGVGSRATAYVHAQARRAGCSEIHLVAVHGADRFWRAQGFDYIETDGPGPYGAGSFSMWCEVVPDRALRI